MPIFKGYLGVYASFSALSWFFLRREIENLNSDLSISIGELIETIEEELKLMRK